jgi:hypothetical protein
LTGLGLELLLVIRSAVLVGEPVLSQHK